MILWLIGLLFAWAAVELAGNGDSVGAILIGGLSAVIIWQAIDEQLIEARRDFDAWWADLQQQRRDIDLDPDVISDAVIVEDDDA